MSENYFLKEMIDASVMAGRNAERERIIKLIETDIEQCDTLQEGRICTICDGKREAIELLGVKP